jgi:hypothetical protein
VKRTRGPWTPRFAVMMFTAAVASSSAGAHAATPDSCLTAPLDGQKAWKAGRLLDARDDFATCSLRTCPAEVVEDCMRWMRQVDDALPSVVVAARDGKGRDLVDVRVSIDGMPPADAAARAIRLDPGSHTLLFHREGSADVSEQVLLREGEKNREVLATFEGPASASSAPEPARVGSERPVPVAAWVFGGVGAVSLVSFATFGTLGILDRGADHCDTGCPADQKNAIATKFLIADVSLGVGVVALAVAAWFYLSRPAAAPQSMGATGMLPFVGLRF